MRAKFGLHDASAYVLNEYQCALMHAEGSSKGKLYVTQAALCFSGSLFGRETRAVFTLSDVISLERVELPAPNHAPRCMRMRLRGHPRRPEVGARETERQRARETEIERADA